MPRLKPPTRKPALCATSGPRQLRRSPPQKRPARLVISTPQSPRPRRPRRWQRHRFSRRPAKRNAGRTWKFVKGAQATGRAERAMIIRRRDFLKTSAAATLVAGLPRLARGADTASVYDLERFGNARILH
ncbi:hypothetical protein chiPu_0027124, partial [Chiloscyllium punctatum]|nr:hypothetical protein [Chiloscyllium punctatum]